MKKSRKPVWALLGIGLIIMITVLIYWIGSYRHIRKDFERLEKESYDTVFLSMYPIDNYAEEDYTHFRGMQTVCCDYEIPNDTVLKWYMKKVASSGNTVRTVYLGVDPQKVEYTAIQELAQSYPEIAFEIVYIYPQITYWMDKSEDFCEKAVQRYLVFAQNMLGVTNVNLYFFSGEEWLICNKGNYESELLTNVAVSQFLMCNSDTLHSYRLKPETVEQEMAKLQELIDSYRSNPVEYVDASGYDIVFLGDSIIGNYIDSMSVPQVVGNLTGAEVYNCGLGGMSAAAGENSLCPVPRVVRALTEEDASLLPGESVMKQGVESFLKRPDQEKNLMFVINLGLNDYFNGHPVSSQEPYDEASYSGALRIAIEALQEHYPEARILLNTPNFTIYYECGEEVRSEKGGRLTDYVEAVIQLGEELGVEVLDNYHELPITETNWPIYQSDGCHLNERGRFLLGSRIALRIQ